MFDPARWDSQIFARLAPRRLATLALGGLLAAAIACHAALLPLGKWQPDEFSLFYNQLVFGRLALIDRVSGWSPRPIPELLIWAYGGLVHWIDRPLTVPCLAVLWAGLLLALYGAARRTRRQQPALIALTLLVAFLLLAKPGETFYWPAAALAYLSCLGALGAVCILAEDPSPRSWLLGLALVVAAWTTEIGATYVLINAGLLLAVWPVAGKRLRPPWLAWTVAVAAAAYVVIITATHRATMPDAPVAPLGTTFAATLPVFLQELIGVQIPGDDWFGVAGLTLKLMLFLGFRPGPDEVPTDRRWRLEAVLRGVALLLAALASIVFAYRQFGAVCCERHVSFRQGLVVLALYSFAQAWPTRLLWPARAALLAIPLAAALAWRLPDIRFDRGLIRQTLADNAAIWQSGRAAGSVEMEWRNAPVPRVANGWLLDPGTYVRTSESEPDTLDWRYFAVLAFFGKSKLHVP